MLLEFVLAYLIWVLAWVVVLTLRYRETIIACWREPVLSKPVLIFESDDWGPGMETDACQLSAIAKLLGKYSDSLGRHPVMTLGAVLAVPDAMRIKSSAYKIYYKNTLDETPFSSILKQMGTGVDSSVFSIQLHGMEHYWPENLMTALQSTTGVKVLLDHGHPLRTETLPNVLQSRWLKIDGQSTHSLNDDEIEQAVRAEAEMFRSIFSVSARVIVPPTFVWNHKVEINWKKCGLEYLVTPGAICSGRDSQGIMKQDKQVIYNGLRSTSGLHYLVRNNYFEPALGHTPTDAVSALVSKTKLGRPTLLEIHRFNFCNSAAQGKDTLDALEQCIKSALKQLPDLRFMSTSELGDIYADHKCGDNLINNRVLIRVSVFMERIWACQALRKWLYLSSLFLLVKSPKVFKKYR